MPKAFVYLLTSKKRGTLYTGVTSDLLQRMEEHHRGTGSSFVKRYGVKRLVYFEEYPLYADAIRRETNLKKWKRAWNWLSSKSTTQAGMICWRVGIAEWVPAFAGTPAFLVRFALKES